MQSTNGSASKSNETIADPTGSVATLQVSRVGTAEPSCAARHQHRRSQRVSAFDSIVATLPDFRRTSSGWDIDALEEAVDRLERYERFRPGRFDRRKLNRRLRQYAEGDEEWLWE